MSDSVIYSNRLGAISREQFSAATAKFGLGTFLRAEPITTGLFGQNVFVTTSEGEFVLRGAPHWVAGKPHDLWQFSKEVFFAGELHAKTKTPVPWPQMLDKDKDIFGWPYILMPRMAGTCFDDRSIRTLAKEAQFAVARALGTQLAVQQTLQSPFAGDFDLDLKLRPYPRGALQHMVDETASFAASAARNDAWLDGDEYWVREIFDRALARGPSARPSVYVHGDYKLNNLAIAQERDTWRVSGLFDLHESHFGDGTADVCRQACSYLDTDRDLANEFLRTYREAAEAEFDTERMALCAISDRIRFWEYFTRPPEIASWLRGKTFRTFAEPYVKGIEDLLKHLR